ncbi:MAG: AmmeMemoRadiSam system protein B [Thermoguttaceae bacterium]
MTFSLTAEQQRRLFVAAATRVATLVTKRESETISQTVPELASREVIGAFVSFKRGGELRSCMGCLADKMLLGEAVDLAVQRALCDDPRFSPIASGELIELSTEVWLLSDMTKVKVAPEMRAEVVEIGRHGIQIILGGSRGLLLPGVATEHGFDAVGFLEAVCRKAGLPRDAWKSPQANFFTFEGLCVRDKFPVGELAPDIARDLGIASRVQQSSDVESLPTEDELRELRQVCESAFDQLVLGRTPSRLYPQLWNGRVSGAAVVLALPDRPLMICSQIGVRPEKSLQVTLMELVQMMWEQVSRLGATTQEIEDATFDIAVYNDPIIHGTTQQYDMNVLDPQTRCVMVSGEIGWIALYRPTATPTQLVREATAYVMAEPPRAGDVISFAIASTVSPLLVTSVSRPNVGDEERAASVAGSFYPATADEIARECEAMECLSASTVSPRVASAVMLPHAGWVYSGSLAVATLAKIEVPRRVIVFAPKHRPGGSDWAIAPHRLWRLASGDVLSDTELAIRLDIGVDLFHLDAEPHQKEHAIEVLLPFLRRRRDDVRVVGVTLASAAWHTIHDAAVQLATVLAEELAEKSEMPLLVVSSDMHHFASEEQTLRVDELALDAIRGGDPHEVLRVVHENKISMCGVTPCVLVMETLRLLGKLTTPEIVGHTTSAAASGDRSRVVGYAGVIW